MCAYVWMARYYDLSEEIELDKQKKHTIEVVVDRLVIRKEQKASTSGDGTTSKLKSGAMNCAPTGRLQSALRFMM